MTTGTLNAIRYRASGTILNPWYVYPVSITLASGGPPTEKAPEISSPCSMLFPDLGIQLFAGARDLTFATSDSEGGGFVHVEPIRQFLMYRTFLNFNHESIDSAPEPTPEQTDTLRFTVRRLVRNETPTPDGVAVHHTDAPKTISVSNTDIRRFLAVLDQPLAHALGFYLRADNPRYVLIEHYKAFESLSSALGGKAAFVSALRPYGVTDASRRRFTGLCNDSAHSPTDIGRHAPKPRASLRVIYSRDPFSDPRFIDDLEVATRFCRQMIDAYVEYRSQT